MRISTQEPKAVWGRLEKFAGRLEVRTPKESLGWPPYMVFAASCAILSFTSQTMYAAHAGHLDRSSSIAHIVLTFWSLVVMAGALTLTVRFNPSQGLRVFWTAMAACAGAAATMCICFSKIR